VKVAVEEDKCVAAGQCVWLAPDVFDQRDEDGAVILVAEAPALDDHDLVREAAMACPARAIHLDES
jgi:ferredoxin